MPPINVTYSFENEEEMRSWLNRSANAPVAESADTDDDEPTRAETPGADEPTRDDTDADGMPYDESVHSDPPSFTADGLWRARRGKADEAKAARAAFKAGGGNEEPPADIQTRTADIPGMAMPGATAPVAETAAPVTLEDAMAKAAAALADGKIDRGQLIGIYKQTTGVDDADPDAVARAAYAVYQVNETARANLVAALPA